MKLRIEILGLALGWLEGEYWVFRFVCDECHLVKFTHIEYLATGESNTKADAVPLMDIRKIVFPLDGTSEPKGQGYEHILNLSSSEFHDQDEYGKSWLKPNDSPEKVIVELKIGCLPLHCFGMTDFPYYAKQNGDASDPRLLGYKAKVIGFDLDLTEPIELRLGDEPWFIDSDGIGIHLLRFDNDCKKTVIDDENDFLNFYQIVLDRRDPDLKYVGGKLPFKANGVLRGWRDIKILTSDQGNCDPAVSDPPPGPLGS